MIALPFALLAAGVAAYAMRLTLKYNADRFNTNHLLIQSLWYLAIVIALIGLIVK